MAKIDWLCIDTMLNFSDGGKWVIPHWHNVKFLQQRKINGSALAQY